MPVKKRLAGGAGAGVAVDASALDVPPVALGRGVVEPEEDLRGLSSYGTRTEGHVPQGAVLFASERVDTAPSWRELEPGTLAVARRDLRVDLHQV